MFVSAETAVSVQIWETEDVWPGNGFNLQLKNSDAWSGLSCLPLYDSQLRSHKRNFLFIYVFLFFFTAKVHFSNWFCFLYFAGFPRKLTGKSSFHVFFFHISLKISVCGWVIHTAVVGTHRFPEEGNGPGLLPCFTVRTSESEPNLQALPPPPPPFAHICAEWGTKGSLFWGWPVTDFHCEKNSGLSLLGPV